MGYSYSDIAHRWAERVAGRTTKPNLASRTRAPRSRVWADDRNDVIYSYGTHFPMAVPLRDRKGRVTAILVNGDRRSNSTSGHQSHVRRAVAGTGLPSVIVPFSALDNAIGRHPTDLRAEDVEIVHVTHDRHETIKHRARELPPRAKVYQWGRRNPETKEFETTSGYHVGGSHVTVTEDEQGPLYEWTTYRHWLGESLLRLRIESEAWARCPDCADRRPSPDFVECGRCLSSGRLRKVYHRRAYFLSGFDRNERRPLYFLAELPRGVHPTTVDEAVECLKPETVKAAELLGREVKRQGDIFAVPLPGTDKRTLRKRGATFDKDAPLLGTNHVATEVAALPDGTLVARGTLRHAPAWRRPDHARVGLGKTWHVIVKNTVPVTVAA